MVPTISEGILQLQQVGSSKRSSIVPPALPQGCPNTDSVSKFIDGGLHQPSRGNKIAGIIGSDNGDIPLGRVHSGFTI